MYTRLAACRPRRGVFFYRSTGVCFREEANESRSKLLSDGERSTVGGGDGNRRPRSKSAEGNREVQSKRDITLSKTGCYDPFSSTSSSPSFCSLSDQLLLIKILAANLPGSPSSSPPRPPSLSLPPLCHVAPSLPPPLKTCCHQRLKHLVFSLSSATSLPMPLFPFSSPSPPFQSSIFAPPRCLTLVSPSPSLHHQLS